MILLLKKYQKIFIYRGGVSEGQLSVVTDHEDIFNSTQFKVTQLKSCLWSGYSPDMSVIVVQKRIKHSLICQNDKKKKIFM